MIQVGCSSRETNSNIRGGLQNSITCFYKRRTSTLQFYSLTLPPIWLQINISVWLVKTPKELLFYLVHERSKCQCTISTSSSNNNISSKLQCSHNRKSSVLEKRMKNLNEKEILDNTLKQKNEISHNVHCQCHNGRTSIKRPLKHPVTEVSKLLSVKYSQ